MLSDISLDPSFKNEKQQYTRQKMSIIIRNEIDNIQKNLNKIGATEKQKIFSNAYFMWKVTTNDMPNKIT